MPQVTVDFAAAGRVAKRVELKNIRLTEIAAKCDPQIAAPLEPTVDVQCEVARQDASALEIVCNCKFSARTTQAEVAEAVIKYLLVYEIQGSEPVAEGDVTEFARSNGILNAWPFLRESLHGLTCSMGYAAYTLPTFHFAPKTQAKKESASRVKSVPAATKHEPTA